MDLKQAAELMAEGLGAPGARDIIRGCLTQDPSYGVEYAPEDIESVVATFDIAEVRHPFSTVFVETAVFSGEVIK